jgi:hypothetical protein
MDTNKSTTHNTGESSSSRATSIGRRGRVVNGNRQTPLKRKSSLKNLDSSSSSTNSLRIRNNVDNSDENFDQSSKGKAVRFSIVDVRDYSLCLGDNPSVSRGVPISLDWHYDDIRSFELDSYELDRSDSRRGSEELKLPSLQRIQLLKRLGYSRGEINEQTKEVQLAKQKRFLTRRSVEREDRVKALVRSMFKFFRNILPISSTQKSADWSCAAKAGNSKITCISQSEEDTLESSGSSKKSDISATDCCGLPLSLIAEGSDS